MTSRPCPLVQSVSVAVNPEALAKVVNPGPQPAATKLVVIGLQGDLARAALVTPIGLADWRAQADGSVRVEGVTGRRLTLRLSE